VNWAQIKQKARDAVHGTFAVPGLYSDSKVTDLEIMVRLHRKSAYLGDNYDEFSPGYFSEINRVIVDLREVTPERGATIRIPDFENVEVSVENYNRQGEHYALCEVRA
tara:strand:+ start:560 stop:883 length:324 start_codon:yes stop_codon:yes gene_type:complete